jgi:hypothetical protein
MLVASQHLTSNQVASMANPPLGQSVLPEVNRRRWLLSAGALAGAGLTMPQLLRAESSAAPKRRARNCIVFFLEGGPAHQDLWDMKPDAPAEIRGEFQPISTTVPGVHVCEHLPMFARQMHHVPLVRAEHHKIDDHKAGAYQALTGRSPLNGSRLIIRD